MATWVYLSMYLLFACFQIVQYRKPRLQNDVRQKYRFEFPSQKEVATGGVL